MAMRGGAHASSRAISGVPPETLFGETPKHHTRGRVCSPDLSITGKMSDVLHKIARLVAQAERSRPVCAEHCQ